MKYLLALSLLFSVSCADTQNQSRQRAEPVIENTAQAKAIEKYLADNFGIPGATTSWYDNIKGISVQGDAVLVKTNLLPGDNKASSICGAISGYVYSSNNRALGLQKVRLYGVNSETLVDRDGLSDDCS